MEEALGLWLPGFWELALCTVRRGRPNSGPSSSSLLQLKPGAACCEASKMTSLILPSVVWRVEQVTSSAKNGEDGVAGTLTSKEGK